MRRIDSSGTTASSATSFCTRFSYLRPLGCSAWLTFLLLTTGPAWADTTIYGCVDEASATIEFRDLPCRPGETELASAYSAPSTYRNTEERNEKIRQLLFTVDSRLKQLQLEIEGLQHERNDKMLLAQKSGLVSADTQRKIRDQYEPDLESRVTLVTQLRKDRRTLMDRLI